MSQLPKKTVRHYAQHLTPTIELSLSNTFGHRAIMKNCKGEVVQEAVLSEPASIETFLDFARNWLELEIKAAKREYRKMSQSSCSCECCECCK